MMKLLIMCQGNTLDSLIARGMKQAEWYLLVDPTSLVTEAFPIVHREQQVNIPARAAAHGVTTILTGSEDAKSRVVLTPTIMTVELGELVTVREAVLRWRSGAVLQQVTPAETPQRFPAGKPSWYRRPLALTRGARVIHGGWSRLVTPRGRHHIQQYAGRGH
jgi:hypothetical protein